MKEHLKKYFPDRFEDSDSFQLASKIKWMMISPRDIMIRTNCEKLVQRIFNDSNELKLLAGAMKRYGCNFKLSRHVACENCSNCHGGYDPDTNQIVICQNNHLTANRVMSTIFHEMIHMFDYCRAEFDFNNLEHVACSEIRAANLTYCSLLDRLRFGGPGFLDLRRSHQYCVKDVAFQSVKAYSPETDDEELWRIVDKVFPGCYNDLEPFGRRPTSGTRDLKQSFRERYYYGYVY